MNALRTDPPNVTSPGGSPAATIRVPAWVSVLILLHVAAVFIAPCSVSPSSQLSRAAWFAVHPYLDAAYLNHGYHFFAPEPGPSHLIRYELERADGTTKRGFFPDRQQHWPRLLYHRHFMLSEHLNALAESGASQEQIDVCIASFARHLLNEHDAQTVRLYLMRHLLPRPDEVMSGMRLDDSSLFREKPLGTFSKDS